MAIPDAASGVNEFLNTLPADRVTAWNDDRRIEVRIEADWALEVVRGSQTLHHICMQILCTTQQVIFRNVFGGWLTEILDQMWMAASLTKAK